MGDNHAIDSMGAYDANQGDLGEMRGFGKRSEVLETRHHYSRHLLAIAQLD